MLRVRQDYEKFCIDVYFSIELNAAEWAEQCQGLGCDMSQGVDFEAFESLFLEYGARSAPAASDPSICLQDSLSLSLSLSDNRKSPPPTSRGAWLGAGRDVVADFTLIFPLVSSEHVVLTAGWPPL